MSIKINTTTSTDAHSREMICRRQTLSVSPTLAVVIEQAIAYHPRVRFSMLWDADNNRWLVSSAK